MKRKRKKRRTEAKNESCPPRGISRGERAAKRGGIRVGWTVAALPSTPPVHPPHPIIPHPTSNIQHNTTTHQTRHGLSPNLPRLPPPLLHRRQRHPPRQHPRHHVMQKHGHQIVHQRRLHKRHRKRPTHHLHKRTTRRDSRRIVIGQPRRQKRRRRRVVPTDVSVSASASFSASCSPRPRPPPPPRPRPRPDQQDWKQNHCSCPGHV